MRHTRKILGIVFPLLFLGMAFLWSHVLIQLVNDERHVGMVLVALVVATNTYFAIDSYEHFH